MSAPASAARIAANKANAAKSTGPKTEGGKARSRCNALKHGLTGAGVALPNEVREEVGRRFEALEGELAPDCELGTILVRRVALLSVRLDRSVSQETAALSDRVRQAGADFRAPEGLDAESVDRLRAEAMARAMFDPSKEASLARSYEAAAERGLFRALREFRQIQREAKAKAKVQAETQARAQAQAKPTSQGPAMDEATFRKVLASFSEFDKVADAFEADYADLDPGPEPARPGSAREEAPAAGPRRRGAVEPPSSVARPR